MEVSVEWQYEITLYKEAFFRIPVENTTLIDIFHIDLFLWDKRLILW